MLSLPKLASVAHFDASLTGDQEVEGSVLPGLATFFVEIDHEIFSVVILSQERHLSVSGKRTNTG